MRVNSIKDYGNYKIGLSDSHTNISGNSKIFNNVQNTKGNLMSYDICASRMLFTGKINPEIALSKLISQLDLIQTSGKITPEMITDEMSSLLLKIARGKVQNAYPPSSNSKAGAAILTEDGRLYKGSSFEHGFVKQRSIGEFIAPKYIISAEEKALSNMTENGDFNNKIVAIAVTTKHGVGYDYFPVLSARNLIREFVPQKDAKIILSKNGKPHYDNIIFNMTD